MNRRSVFGILLVASVAATACSDPSGPKPEPLPAGCTSLVQLDYAIGQFSRLKGAEDATFPCLRFDPGHATGQAYLLLFENMTPTGRFSNSLFPGVLGDTAFAYTIEIEHLDAAGAVVSSQHVGSMSHVGARAIDTAQPGDAARFADYTWDFGAGRLRELHPTPPGNVSLMPRLLRDTRLQRDNGSVALGSVATHPLFEMSNAGEDPMVGDTIEVLMEGLPHLGTTTGFQQAVIRFVADDLIIAEDIRLATLARAGGGFNTPIAAVDLAAIAQEYTAVARVQGDLFFEGRHNVAVENVPPHRIIAIHSLTPAEDVWGYTYGAVNYFVFDYWVATDGVTKTINQHPQRLADNLFTHEITHMRHAGMLQRDNRHWVDSQRGHRWLVEGFARFAERLPIAARLLGTTTPSRTGNIVLPRNPEYGNAYFLDDVPTYLHASSSSYFGYHASAFVFDYFADQVALQGGDWMAATREFLLAANSRATLDEVVSRWLPDLTFADLFTRSRVALYTDDIGTPGLPPRTQYLQFQLRASRPAPANMQAQDPRVLWTPLPLSSPGTIPGAVAAGAANGHIIPGGAVWTAGSAHGISAVLIRMTGPVGANAIVSVTRIH